MDEVSKSMPDGDFHVCMDPFPNSFMHVALLVFVMGWISNYVKSSVLRDAVMFDCGSLYDPA